MAAIMMTSASGLLSLLDEPEAELKVHALQQLNSSDVVDRFWSEIATAIPKIEMLYEDEDFGKRALAAVVASKVFYHLEELDDALKYALGAGDLFDVEQHTEYVETLIAKCIDEYIRIRVEAFNRKMEPEVDDRLEAVVLRMFDRCYADAQYTQALGIAVESRRLDLIKKSIEISGDVPAALKYCFGLCQDVIVNRDFRHQVLRVMVDMYRTLPVPDYVRMCQCLLFLDEHEPVATCLNSLLEKDDPLMAYQVAFDLTEIQNQPFLMRVVNSLPGGEEETDDAAAEPKAEKKEAEPESDLSSLKKILTGETPINLYLHFLYGHNRSDLNILNEIKDKLEPRNSITHNATVMAHAIMHAGTTHDTFLRDNLEWLARANNWAKFTATASIGVIHQGHHEESLKLLQPYLPQAGVSGSPYQEGGALYALGLIHSNHGGDKVQYLLDALKDAGTNEVVQHGASLGLGLVAMATGSQDIYDVLKDIVFTENAVAGEAAGLAMGLVLLGTGNGAALEEMLAYAHDTQHHKIIRGLAMGIALIVYGREEEADTLIEQLVRDKDPLVRYGGMYAIAMAYVATGNNSAIRRLLHVAVSDVSDDVRRAAVTALGFVLCKRPEQVPRIVSLLAESYNPHVRYGACFAVGIACAGSGMKEAIALLEPLCKDKVDFVRQGAFIALAMVLIQHNETLEPKVKWLRSAIMDSVKSKGDTMTKLGAILGAGILDAGGRNMTLALVSPSGHRKMAAITGMAIFPQFWYWYPDVHFLSLAFTPTAVIGLNKDLKMPAPFKFKSNARPSLYAYPEVMVFKTEEKKKTLKKATLSVTAKAKARSKSVVGKEEAEKEDGDVAMKGVDKKEEDKKEEDKKEEDGDVAMADKDGKEGAEEEEEGEKKEKKEEEEAKAPEPLFEVLSNPARVTWKQQNVLSFSTRQRYVPVVRKLAPGIVMLRDAKPGENEDIVVPKPPKIGIPGISDDEPEPPKPFEFTRYT